MPKVLSNWLPSVDLKQNDMLTVTWSLSESLSLSSCIIRVSREEELPFPGLYDATAQGKDEDDDDIWRN